MTPGFEILLLILAIVVVALLGADLWRRRDRATDDEGASPVGREGRISHAMKRAGLPGGIVGFVVLAAVVALVVYLVVVAINPLAWWIGLLLSLLAVYLLWTAIRGWGRRRAQRFEVRLVDAIDTMIGGLLAGENTTQAMATAAEAAQEPVRTELEEAVNRLSVGMSMREALSRMVDRYDSEGVRIFAQTLIARSQTGGDLAPVLRSVNRLIRERIRMRQRLHSYLIGARASAIAMALLPYLVIAFIYWQRPGWFDSLMNDAVGFRLLLFAVILQVLGFLWLRRIMRVEI